MKTGLLKKVIYILIITIILPNLAILISGKTYLYQVILHNYAGLDDYKIFQNRTVSRGNPQQWEFAKEYNSKQLTGAEEKFLRDEMKSVAFLVVKNNKIIFEKYWEGYGPASLSNSFSMAKTVVSILVGIAIKEGNLKSVDQTLGELLPEYKNTDKSKITIKNLLTMSSGLGFYESYSDPFADSAESYYTSDQKKQAANLRQVREPGKVFIYQSCNQIYLAQILEKGTGMKISDYASEKLWKVIGTANDAVWSLDKSEGLEKGFCCFNSNARDFARIGLLYLNRGRAGKTEVVPESYVNESITPANLKEENGEPCTRYGYSWWLKNYRGQFVFYANGILGQYIIVIPEKNIVVVRLGHKMFYKKEKRFMEDTNFYIDTALSM